MKQFPIPVVALGPGSQTEEVELEYITMPKGMETYHPPILPEPEEVANLTQGKAALHAIVDAVGTWLGGGRPVPIELKGMADKDLALVNQVLGEGEVSARVEGGLSVLVQESVFAGVWRCIAKYGERLVSDSIQVGPVPGVLVDAARGNARQKGPIAIPGELPVDVMNAPSIITELNDHIARWQAGMPAHVINLTLLPLSPQDVGFLDEQLGAGSVLVLSRGYGNCRVMSTGVQNCWRVVYYNSQDAIILNTVEIVDIPEVACAAREDLADSHERLTEVLQWVEGT
jgi:hydrogenase-1 operon protein HyaF